MHPLIRCLEARMHRWLNAVVACPLVLGAEMVYAIGGPVIGGAVPEVTESLPPDVREAVLDNAALALATAIRESRRQALERGVDSIPPQIRAVLEPYFPATILDKARWTTAGGISLDGMLTNWFSLEG